MKSVASFKRGVAKARRLWRDKRFDEALAAVNQLLEDWPNNAHLLIMRADLIRLQADEDGQPTLEDAKADLERATSLDEDSPSALIELGHFAYAIEDDSETASKRFQEAIQLCRSLLQEALIGRGKGSLRIESRIGGPGLPGGSPVARLAQRPVGRGGNPRTVERTSAGALKDTLTPPDC